MLNHEFAEKMIKAKQLEMEAIGCLMPEPVRTHIDVINKELKDMAKEMMDFTKNNILSQAATSMLAQANQMPQSVLQLLQ